MQVELKERAAELLVVAGPEPLPQVVVLLLARDAVEPLLHEGTGVLPIVTGDAVKELEARLLVGRRRGVGSLEVIEQWLALFPHAGQRASTRRQRRGRATCLGGAFHQSGRPNPASSRSFQPRIQAAV